MADQLNISALPDPIEYGSGMSFYDFDNDGWDDLSYTMTNDSLIFYKNFGGIFQRVSFLLYGEGEVKQVLWVDYNNDTYLDIAISTFLGTYSLWRNDGNFNFTNVSASAGLSQVNERTYGMTFADYNRDGYLDLYVAIYGPNGLGDTYATLNKLYKNNGNGTFTDVTLEAGVDDGYQSSFQGTWFDYDNDGWVDLFVINDRVFENSLYKNNGDGTFTDVSDIAGIGFGGEDPMTCTVGDFDNDGDLDVFLTNTDQGPALLLVNNGDGTYTESAEERNVDFIIWAWGAVWADYNNDGYQDLYVSTGHWNEDVVENLFFVNHADFIFTQEQEIFESNHVARSFAPTRGDFDNNGFYDIAVLNEFPYNVFLWQNSGNDNNYVKITLEGTVSNHYAIGTWIRVFANGQQYTQYTMCGENYVSQNSQHHIIGVGDAAIIDSIQVEYVSGHIDYYYNIAVNEHHYFTEGETYTAQIFAENNSFCQGDSLQLSAGQHYIINWNTGAQDSIIYVNQSDSYWFEAQNEFGITAQSDTVQIEINPNPEITVITENPLCFGDSNGSLYLINETGVPLSAIFWSNGMIGDSLSNLEQGNYFFEYTDINNCVSSGVAQLLEPDELFVQVFTTPDNGQQDGSILLNVFGGIPPYSVLINEEPAQFVNENLSFGTYTVKVIDFNNCIYEQIVVIDNFTSTYDQIGKSQLIYPNPVSVGTELYVSSDASVLQPEIELFDSYGRKQRITSMIDVTNFRIIVNLNSCSPGIYILSLKTVNTFYVSQLIIR